MSDPDEPAGRTATRGGTDAAGTRNGTHDPGLSEELARMLALLRTKGALSLARLRLGVERAAWLSAILLWAGFALAVATVIAMVALFRGLAAAIDTMTQTTWAGDFGAGVLFFGGAALALVLVAARRRRAQLRRLQQRFGP
jgi:hypothetical protein